MTEIKQLYEPRGEPMKIVGLMFGSGSNLVKILEHERAYFAKRQKPPYRMAAIFTDNRESKAENIAGRFQVPLVVNDIGEFYKSKGKPLNDMEVRVEYDKWTVHLLSEFEAPVAAFGGYMKIATPMLLNAFICINVHPADLSVVDDDGKRMYTGAKAVKKAIKAGEQYLHSTTHIMTEEVDQGPILMVSPKVKVNLPNGFTPTKEGFIEAAEKNQELLKVNGDWLIFPRTIDFMARELFQKDEQGALYFDNKPIPQGILIEDIVGG